MRIADRTAITGVGWSRFSRDSGTSVTNLAAKACLNAIDDAGLTTADVDGVITFRFFDDTVAPNDLCQTLGIDRCNFQSYDGLGGGWNCSAVLVAAMAIHAGVCRNVLVYRAANGRSDVHLLRQSGQGRPARTAQFMAPFGSSHAASTFGHVATAYLARYGGTPDDFGPVAVTQRQHAALNTKAIMRQPITLDDHRASPWIVYPFRLLDCCLESDAAAAIVVSSADQARDCRHGPVYVTAGLGGSGQTAGAWQTNAANAAPLLYDSAGITARDLSFAQLYDPFTFMCMVHMEDYGLVEPGGVVQWVRDGRNRLDGDTPVNTHGGLLSEAYVHGLNHVIEAVQQLRPGGVRDDLCHGQHTFDRSECRQVRNPRIGLVCGEAGASSLLLRAA